MPPVDVNLESLRTELRHAREELDTWSHGLAGDARKAKHEHEHAMARARAESAALVEREEALSHAVEALAQRLDEEEAEEEALEEEAVQAREAAESLPGQVAALAADVAAAKARLAADTDSLDQRMLTATGTLDTVSGVVDKYARHLGLAFSTTPRGEFSIAFTSLDASQPERAFTFTLLPGAASGEPYTLTGCQPRLESAGALLAQLNEQPQRGLARFVGAMRAAFKASILDAAPAALAL